MANTERVELPDGHWWEIRKRLPYGVQTRMKAVAVRGAALSIPDAEPAPTGETPEQAAAREARRLKAMRESMTAEDASLMLDITARVEAIKLVGCTVAWSFPGPVSEAALAERDDDDVQAVLARMTALYEGRTEAEAKAIKKDSPSP